MKLKRKAIHLRRKRQIKKEAKKLYDHVVNRLNKTNTYSFYCSKNPIDTKTIVNRYILRHKLSGLVKHIDINEHNQYYYITVSI